MAGSAQAAELNVAATGAENVPIVIPTTGPFVPAPGVPPLPPDPLAQPNAMADKYPSSITVAGPAGTSVTGLKVTLQGLSHTWPRDLDILLVGPQGQKVMLMSDVCGNGTTQLSDATFTFDDTATDTMPIGPRPEDPSVVEGCTLSTYKPTNEAYVNGLETDYAQDYFDDPAPGEPYSTSLADFNGTDPNGVWRLFVSDDTVNAGGTLDGWSLQITTTDPPAQPVTPPVTPVTPQPAQVAQTGPVCLPTPVAPKANTKKGKVTLSATQFRINQRIFAAGVLRANAIDAWLKAGIQTNDLCGGAIGATKLANGITTGTTSLATILTPPSPRAVEVPPLKVKKGVKFTATRSQLMINRRIAVALKERAQALEARIDGRLTGGDLADGAVTAAKLTNGLTITGSPAQPKPAVSTAGTTPNVPVGNVQRNVATVRSSQQIAADGIRILNRVRAQLQSGLSGDNFADKSIATPNLAPDLRK